MSNIVTIPNINESELTTAQGIVRQIDDPKDKEYLNFYERPYPIISDKLKGIIEPYLPKSIGLPMSLANADLKLVIIYWLLDLDVVENQGVKSAAKGSRTENQDSENTGLKSGFNTIPKIILKISDIAGKKLFKMKIGLKEYVIADLDILEIILRSSISDIGFEEISVE